MRYVRPATPGVVRNLDQLRRQARNLHRAYLAGQPEAVQLVAAHFTPGATAPFLLAHAQLVIARFHGAESWPRLVARCTAPSVQDLVTAVRSGDRRRVRSLLRRNPELAHLDLAPDNEHQALHFAVLARNRELTELLLEAGADPHRGIYPHRDATSPRTLARERGYDELVAAMDAAEERRRAAAAPAGPTEPAAGDALLEAADRGHVEELNGWIRADAALVHAVDRAGGTALHRAAARLEEAAVAVLLQHGAGAAVPDFHGHTPLDRAVLGVHWRQAGSRERFVPVARRLRDAGAPLTPLAAVSLADEEALRRFHAGDSGLLCRSIPPNCEGGLLTVAVLHRLPAMVRLLLELGLDPDERTRVPGLEQEEWSAGAPLWHCAASGCYETAALLLAAGADPNVHVYASGSPVFAACGTRDERMVELLLRHGGRLEVDTLGLYRQTERALRLLRAGLAPNEVEQLLWAAACGGDPEVVRACLEHLDWPPGDRRWFRLLEQPLRLWNHGSSPWRPRTPVELDRSTYLECFRLVLERSGPDAEGRFGMRPLHDVAAAGSRWGQPVMTEPERVAFARLLLDAGADLSPRDELLCGTALAWAARWGRLELVRLLLSRGADACDPEGEPWARPLARALRCGHHEVARLLREHGAKEA